MSLLSERVEVGIYFKPNLDESQIFNEQLKKDIQKGRDSLEPEGNTLKIDFFRDSKFFTVSPVTYTYIFDISSDCTFL